MTRLRPSRISSELLTLRQTLKAFDHSLRRLAPILSVAVSMNGAPKEDGRAGPRISPKAHASMVLQGRYMGFMRQLKPRQKAQVRKIREAKGVRVAIQRAQKLVTR